MVLCAFFGGQKARKVPENGYLSRAMVSQIPESEPVGLDLRVLGDLECVIDLQSEIAHR